jgi:hypothetical protein
MVVEARATVVRVPALRRVRRQQQAVVFCC